MEALILLLLFALFYQPFYRRFDELVTQGDLDEPVDIKLEAR